MFYYYLLVFFFLLELVPSFIQEPFVLYFVTFLVYFNCAHLLILVISGLFAGKNCMIYLDMN